MNRMKIKFRRFLLIVYIILFTSLFYFIINSIKPDSLGPGCENCNVLLITMDSLRADHVGSYGYDRNTTPNLDALAKKGTIFLNAVSAAPSTSLSLPAIMSSRLPVQSYVMFQTESIYMSMFLLNESYITLADRLKDEGYLTGTFFSSPFVKLTGSDKGFVQSVDVYNPDLTLSDRTIRMEAEKFIGSADKKFFAWIHFQSPHSPYLPPYPYNKSFYKDSYYGSYGKVNLSRQTDLDYYVSQYDGEIRFIDEEIGLLIKYLEEKNLASDTLILISSDHGESFGEHYLYMDHGELYDTNVKVPLIIINPKSEKKNQNIIAQVSTLDIYPTVLGILKIKPEEALDGKSLLRQGFRQESMAFSIQPRPAYNLSNFKEEFLWASQGFLVRTNSWKYIRTQYGAPELYGLDADPGEKINLIGNYSHLRKSIGKGQREMIDSDLKNFHDEN